MFVYHRHKWTEGANWISNRKKERLESRIENQENEERNRKEELKYKFINKKKQPNEVLYKPK